MPAIALVRKPVGVDLALCKRLAQEASRRASAAKSWAILVFGRLNRQRILLSILRGSLPSWPRRTRLSRIKLTPRLCSS